jgi:hypothetical protein
MGPHLRLPCACFGHAWPSYRSHLYRAAMASNSEVTATTAALTLWRVFGLADDFNDQPKPYWMADAIIKSSPTDNIAVMIGEVPEDLLTTLRQWRAQIRGQLDYTTARVFRLLPVAPGPDFSTTGASALTGLPAAEVRTVLGILARAHLAELAPGTTGRWRMHDLVRYTFVMSAAASISPMF